MKKYVIKNCPAFDSKYNECHSKIEPHKLYCMDCADCKLKQIVEKCKNIIKCDNCELNGKQECIFANCTAYYVDSFAKELLQLLDIQELK